MPGRGGRRAGAGRPAGSGWKAGVSEMREETIQRMKSIVGSDRSPLTVVVDMVLDDDLDGPPPETASRRHMIGRRAGSRFRQPDQV